MNRFADFLKKNDQHYKTTSITQAFINILQIYASATDSLDQDIMQPFYNKVAQEFFGGRKREEDATEFWSYLFSAISEKDIRNESARNLIEMELQHLLGIKKIQQQFGISTSTWYYLIPVNIIDENEPQGFIRSISAGLNNYIHEEFKNSTIESNAEYLIISLSIFSFDTKTQSVNKIKTNLTIDENLKLPFDLYELIAMVAHQTKSEKSGHYIAYVKRPNGWWLCDDDKSIIQIGSYESMINANRTDENTYKNDPYILFYAKKDISTIAEPVPVQVPVFLLDTSLLEIFSKDISIIELLLTR